MELPETVPYHELIDRFESQIRPIVHEIRGCIEEQLFADLQHSSVGGILQQAPADACIRLADAWGVADLVGITPSDLLSRFDAIERFIVEMVSSIYCNSQCDLFHDETSPMFDSTLSGANLRAI